MIHRCGPEANFAPARFCLRLANGEQMKKMKKILKISAPGLLLWGADQSLKSWCRNRVGLLEQRPILGQDYLNISRLHNHGLMMDQYSGYPKGYIESYTLYLPLIVLACLIFVMSTRFKQAGLVERAFYGLMIAGGISNLGDHWQYGFVIDTLQLSIWNEQWLPFNLADIGLVVGAGALVFFMSREMWRESHKRVVA